MQGITGKLSGKMGSAVFRVREGAQVVAQYNPVVKNPNSEGQQVSRAAFKLMSQLAAVMAPALGTMGTTKRSGHGTPSQRNEFFKLNYGLVSTSDTAQGVVASVPLEQLQLTNSFREFGSIDADGSTDNITVYLRAADGNEKGGKIALVGFGTMGVTKSPRIIKMQDFDFTEGVATVEFENLEEGDYTVLAYGYIASDELLAKISLDNLHTPNDAPFTGQVNLDQAMADGSVVCTMTAGVNVSVTE